MGTTLIQSNKKGYDPKKLTDQQQAFVSELLSSDRFCITEAARKAGYKHPAQAANKLLKNSTVQAALGMAKQEREERCQLSGDDVLRYLRNALMFNPLQYFRPSNDGKWLIDDPSNLPDDIGRLIESMEVTAIEREGEVRSCFKISFVNKSNALALALKHVHVEEHKVNQKIQLGWDALFEEPADEPDELDLRIQELTSIQST